MKSRSDQSEQHITVPKHAYAIFNEKASDGFKQKFPCLVCRRKIAVEEKPRLKVLPPLGAVSSKATAMNHFHSICLFAIIDRRAYIYMAHFMPIDCLAYGLIRLYGT